MEEEKKVQDESSVQEGVPLDQQKTEVITEQVQNLVEHDNRPAAIELISQLHPGDQGEVIEGLPLETQQQILTNLPPVEAAGILVHLEPENVARVSEGVEPAVLSDILNEVATHVAADVLRQLPEERARDVLGEMKAPEEVIPLLQYPDDTAGGIMVLEYTAVRDDATAADALDMLRQEEPEDVKEAHSVFVTDADGCLVGTLSIVRLALSRPKTIIKNIMDPDIIYVAPETDQEEAAQVMERYGLDQLPVLDKERRLVGIIKSKDVLGVVKDESTEDMYKLVGISGERVFGPLRISMRNRFPWLFINLLTTFLAAAVISVFQSTIARVVTLAVFLPVVAGQGGIGGTQTLTLVVRSMALGEISRHSGVRLLAREMLLGVTHGVLLGVVVGIVAYIWQGNYMLGVVLGLAMIGNMVIAGLTGAAVPLLLTRLRVDPAVASAVIVTTCTDVFGFFMFLGLATLLVTYLL